MRYPNESKSSFAALVSFFILSDNFFDSRPIFGSIGFPELYAESFEKKALEKLNIQEACQTLKIIGVAINFRVQNQLIRSEKIAVTEEKNSSIISKGKIFKSRSKNNLRLLLVNRSMPIALFW